MRFLQEKEAQDTNNQKQESSKGYHIKEKKYHAIFVSRSPRNSFFLHLLLLPRDGNFLSVIMEPYIFWVCFCDARNISEFFGCDSVIQKFLYNFLKRFCNS